MIHGQGTRRSTDRDTAIRYDRCRPAQSGRILLCECAACDLHAVRCDLADRIHRHRNSVRQVNTIGRSPGSQFIDRSLQVIGTAADTDQSNEPNLITRHLDGRIPIVTDIARGRHHTDVTRACIKTTQKHIDGSLITDITTTRCRQGAIRSTVTHRDGASLRFHIYGASPTCQDIPHRILDYMAIG